MNVDMSLMRVGSIKVRLVEPLDVEGQGISYTRKIVITDENCHTITLTLFADEADALAVLM